MAGDMRGCFRGVGRSCRPLLKLQAPAATSECVVGLELSPSLLLTRESRDQRLIFGELVAVVRNTVCCSVMKGSANVHLYYILSLIIANLRTWLANMLIIHQMSLKPKSVLP